MTNLGVFGTSGFAREVADVGESLGYKPFLIAKDDAEASKIPTDWPIVLEAELDRSLDAVYVIGIGENKTRATIAEIYRDKLKFINLIHPSATFGHKQREQIERREGVIICAGVRFTCNTEVGNHTIFNLNATIGHDTIVENFVNIAPGANISGNVRIQQGCWIGTGAVINQGTNDKKLEIGGNTTIGSGAVVVKPCDSNAVYVGAPARRIK